MTADNPTPKDFKVGDWVHYTIYSIWHFWMPWPVDARVDAVSGNRYLISWNVQTDYMGDYRRGKWVSEWRIK